MKFDFDDISIIPEIITSINSRSEVDPYENGFLPIMTSPMDTVVSEENYLTYIDNDIRVCLPREKEDRYTLNYDEAVFQSVSLEQITKFTNFNHHPIGKYICIDMANGHIPKLYNVVKELREKKPELKLIVGNIANPETYKMFARLGVWGIRAGIGGGSVCTTSANIGIHFPYASLIQECYEIKKKYGFKSKIIADGGTRKFSDIIKAVALGADIVMIGSLLNKSLQSCSDPYLWKIFKIKNQRLAKWLFNNKFKLYKKYRGMSTKEVQKKWGNTKLKTAEGISRWYRVEYDLYKWSENLTDYLKSSMSYVNAKTLEEFRGCRIEMITQNAFRRFNK
jgi:IMP dehydrogenase/GMP reductase